MMSDDQIIAVVTAHKEGKPIESDDIFTAGEGWSLEYGPIRWDFQRRKYRVKHEPLEGYVYSGWVSKSLPDGVYGADWIRVREVLE